MLATLVVISLKSSIYMWIVFGLYPFSTSNDAMDFLFFSLKEFVVCISGCNFQHFALVCLLITQWFQWSLGSLPPCKLVVFFLPITYPFYRICGWFFSFLGWFIDWFFFEHSPCLCFLSFSIYAFTHASSRSFDLLEITLLLMQEWISSMYLVIFFQSPKSMSMNVGCLWNVVV